MGSLWHGKRSVWAGELMKTLILYFSKSGHTKKLADAIHEGIGGDMEELRTEKQYSSSYMVSVIQAGIEKFKKQEPQLLPLSSDLSKYDVLFLGAPTWYYSYAPALRVFIEKHDLFGKKVFTFTTSGRSPKDTDADLRADLEKAGACVEGQIHVMYHTHTQVTPKADVDAWIAKAAEALKEMGSDEPVESDT